MLGFYIKYFYQIYKLAILYKVDLVFVLDRSKSPRIPRNLKWYHIFGFRPHENFSTDFTKKWKKYEILVLKIRPLLFPSESDMGLL